MPYFAYQGKKIYFESFGQGEPVLFLHGNTASSKMFEPLMPLYAERFCCYLIDFLGNGRSERVEGFSADLWVEQGRQAAALIRHLNRGKVNLIGTSGGAWTAVNAGLEYPELVEKIVADSFDGRTLHEGFAEELTAERQGAKQDPNARQFYEWCQGEDWEQVVELDTKAILQCVREKRPLFSKELRELRPPVLFMGSRQDTMCRKDMQAEYERMAAVLPQAQIHMFESGGHPAVASNAEQAAEIIRDFLLN